MILVQIRVAPPRPQYVVYRFKRKRNILGSFSRFRTLLGCDLGCKIGLLRDWEIHQIHFVP